MFIKWFLIDCEGEITYKVKIYLFYLNREEKDVALSRSRLVWTRNDLVIVSSKWVKRTPGNLNEITRKSGSH